MKPVGKLNPGKARVQKIATVCLAGVFAVLLVKTLTGREAASGPATRAAASPRVVEAPRGSTLMPGAQEKTGNATGGPAVRQSLVLPDSAGCAPPPNPFMMTPRLTEELTGIRQNRKPAATTPKKPRIQFKLQGIVADLKNGEHVALIDDELLRIGDVHRGYTVLDITRTQAILDDGKDRRVLQLEQK